MNSSFFPMWCCRILITVRRRYLEAKHEYVFRKNSIKVLITSIFLNQAMVAVYRKQTYCEINFSWITSIWQWHGLLQLRLILSSFEQVGEVYQAAITLTHRCDSMLFYPLVNVNKIVASDDHWLRIILKKSKKIEHLKRNKIILNKILYAVNIWGFLRPHSKYQWW